MRVDLDKGAEVARKASSNLDAARSKLERLEKQLARAVTQDRRRQARPVVRYVERVREVPAPSTEKLKVLYLIANPNADPERVIRPDVEIRQVRKVVERAVHAEAIEINDRHAVTFEDFRYEIERMKPHIVHFSGHAASSMLDFDNAQLAPHNEAVSRTFDEVAKTLAEVGQSVRILVLNACDTLEGAEVFLESVPVVVATTRIIDDVEAVVFATGFYSSIAAGESVDVALAEAENALISAFAEDACIESLTRDGLDLATVILVQNDRYINVKSAR